MMKKLQWKKQRDGTVRAEAGLFVAEVWYDQTKKLYFGSVRQGPNSWAGMTDRLQREVKKKAEAFIQKQQKQRGASNYD